MSYLLCTNACIAHLNLKPPQVEERLRRTPRDDVFLCSIVKTELLFGARNSARVAENFQQLEKFFQAFVSLPFDDAAAEQAAVIRAVLTRKGTPIGPNDVLIGAMALANGLTVVTHDTGEFSRIPGLSVEDREL